MSCYEIGRPLPLDRLAYCRDAARRDGALALDYVDRGLVVLATVAARYAARPALDAAAGKRRPGVPRRRPPYSRQPVEVAP